MRLTPVDPATWSDNTIGAAPEPAFVAELLRAEVTSRGSCARWIAVRRVVALLAPVVALAPELVDEVCDDLERAGDLELAPGAELFATPVRAVALATSEWRVVTSVPLAWLQSKLPGAWTCHGIARLCRVAYGDAPAWHEKVVSAGGVVVSPDVWAGFDRVPRAGGDWLGDLDARLQWHPEAAGSLEATGPFEWAGFSTGEDRAMWRNAETATDARLWRARNRWGYWKYAWTAGGPPSSRVFLSLTSDEGARSVFSVAVATGRPVPARVENLGDESVIGVTQWLPRAEFRYLSIMGTALRREGSAARWTIPQHRANEVLARLRDRLGVEVEGARGL